MKNWNFLSWIYLIFAIAGLIFPWYFNLQFIMNSEEALTPLKFIQGGMVNPISSSITVDLFIGATPVVIWMMIEGRKLKMKHLWFYFLSTFLIAFAFACPFFLFMRELKLQKINSDGNHQK